MALSAEAALPSQKEADARETRASSRKAANSWDRTDSHCTDCHRWRQEEEGRPELNGWASRQWTIELIGNPAHDRFYGSRNDRMPAFGEKRELTPRQIEMIVDWMRGEGH